jgi:hypothetical protein
MACVLIFLRINYYLMKHFIFEEWVYTILVEDNHNKWVYMVLVEDNHNDCSSCFSKEYNLR